MLQKVLPRLHGSRRRLEPVLQAVGKFCFDPDSVGRWHVEAFDPDNHHAAKARLPRSFDKVRHDETPAGEPVRELHGVAPWLKSGASPPTCAAPMDRSWVACVCHYLRDATRMGFPLPFWIYETHRIKKIPTSAPRYRCSREAIPVRGEARRRVFSVSRARACRGLRPRSGFGAERSAAPGPVHRHPDRACSAFDGRAGSLPLEVRSRKLGYLHHFRWMLGTLRTGWPSWSCTGSRRPLSGSYRRELRTRPRSTSGLRF